MYFRFIPEPESRRRSKFSSPRRKRASAVKTSVESTRAAGKKSLQLFYRKRELGEYRKPASETFSQLLLSRGKRNAGSMGEGGDDGDAERKTREGERSVPRFLPANAKKQQKGGRETLRRRYARTVRNTATGGQRNKKVTRFR